MPPPYRTWMPPQARLYLSSPSPTMPLRQSDFMPSGFILYFMLVLSPTLFMCRLQLRLVGFPLMAYPPTPPSASFTRWTYRNLTMHGPKLGYGSCGTAAQPCPSVPWS